MNPETDNNGEGQPPVEIPVASLASDVLDEIIRSFIEREGTDYGAIEATLDKKIADVRRQLDRGEIRLMFDPESESVTFVTKHQSRAF